MLKIQKIKLENIRTYSYHGCLKEETMIGSDYLISLTVWADLQKSAKSDLLKDTIDYVLLNKIVEQEMAIPSKLLENIADRIILRIKNEIIEIEKVKIKISKINPPINGDVQKVSVIFQY